MKHNLTCVRSGANTTVLLSVAVWIVTIKARHDEVCAQWPDRHVDEAEPKDRLVRGWFTTSVRSILGEGAGQIAAMLGTVDLAIGNVVEHECFSVSAVDQSLNYGVSDRRISERIFCRRGFVRVGHTNDLVRTTEGFYDTASL